MVARLIVIQRPSEILLRRPSSAPCSFSSIMGDGQRHDTQKGTQIVLTQIASPASPIFYGGVDHRMAPMTGRYNRTLIFSFIKHSKSLQKKPYIEKIHYIQFFEVNRCASRLYYPANIVFLPLKFEWAIKMASPLRAWALGRVTLVGRKWPRILNCVKEWAADPLPNLNCKCAPTLQHRPRPPRRTAN